MLPSVGKGCGMTIWPLIGLPAGVRIEPPAGVRVPRDDFHSGVG